jgi:hypothetical protein
MAAVFGATNLGNKMIVSTVQMLNTILESIEMCHFIEFVPSKKPFLVVKRFFRIAPNI